MGGISTFEFVPSDYKIKYIDSLQPGDTSTRAILGNSEGARLLKVLLAKGVEEEFKIDTKDSDLTIGWLLSEVARRYDQVYETKLAKIDSQSRQKRLVIGLKTAEGIPAMDCYLSQLENSLAPIKQSTLLSVHYSNIKDTRKNDVVNKNSFQFLKVIGCGGYSNVVLARKKDSGRLYAIKVIKKDKTYLNTNKSIYLQEVNIMKKVAGLPFIVGLHYTFQTENELYFAMEPCIGGNLFHFMTHCAKGCLNSSIVKFYVAEIIIALEKIHSKNIMYRDLKPENVLIDIDGHVKLSDFGLSKQIKKRDETSLTFCGSPEYLPPEMLMGVEHSRVVDFYTLGCLIYEMMVGFPPFHCTDHKKLYKRIMAGSLRFPQNMEPEAQDLIAWLLSKDPEERPSEFSEIKKHAFFNDIHWGRFTLKEAIPPWVPDLYKFHGSKQVSLNQVFHKNTLHKERNRTSQNVKNQDEDFKGNLYVHDQNSNRQRVKNADVIEDNLEEILHLEDFECSIGSMEEECIRAQLESHLSKKAIPPMVVKDINTKCSDNYEETDEHPHTDSPNKITSEGSINSLHKYNYSSGTIKRKKPMLRKFGSVEYEFTPKTAMHAQFYQQTFDSFNDAAKTCRLVSRKKSALPGGKIGSNKVGL